MRNLIQAFMAGVAGAVTVAVLISATPSIKTDGNIETDAQLVSTVGRGTAPLIVESVSKVQNLNADKLDGLDATSFALASNTYTLAEIDALLASFRDSRLGFYLTADETIHGDEALGACTDGYHMAQLFEILDPSNLRWADELPEAWSGNYDGSIPKGQSGWVRTGWWSEDINIANANCELWTQTVGYGTVASLNIGSTVQDLWSYQPVLCAGDTSVWCIEDYPGSGSVLP